MDAAVITSPRQRVSSRVPKAKKQQRVAISNSRLIALDEHGVTFKWKDYRVKNGAHRQAVL